MRGWTLPLALAGALLGGCGPRQVEVRTTPVAMQAEVSVHLTNRLPKAVNVYVSTGGPDTFLRQVAANTTRELPVPGVTAGTTVTLRATTIDGAESYERRNVVLNGAYLWTLP